MTHKHKWIYWEWGFESGNYIVCEDIDSCPATLNWDEIERRCNATEYLSADDAEEMGKPSYDMFDWWNTPDNKTGLSNTDKLLAYAGALRGKVLEAEDE